MTSQLSIPSTNHFAKEWPKFPKKRPLNEPQFYVEILRQLGGNSGDWDLLLNSFNSPLPFNKFKEIRQFCAGILGDELDIGNAHARRRRAAWLDDRCSPHAFDEGNCSTATNAGVARTLSNPLSAMDLYTCLKVPRFNYPGVTDAARRLIYIADLDPYYVLALLKTATWREFEPLRDAIWKHLKFHTSLGVQIPTRQYSSFQLEIQMSYFILRSRSSGSDCSQETQQNTYQKPWIDVSFLSKGDAFDEQEQCAVREVQFSLLICGSDDLRWVAYALVNADYDSEELDLTDIDFPWDPIALDGNLDSNLPLWDPREYFLRIFEYRIELVLREWECVIRTIEPNVKRYVNQPYVAMMGQLSMKKDRDEDVKASLNRHRRTVYLISQLLESLTKLNKAWDRFNKCDGDIACFFSIASSFNPTQSRYHLSLRTIRGSFESLKDLQDDLLDLQRSCEDESRKLKYRLYVDNNETSHRNGTATQVQVWLTTPLTLASSLFSMQREVIPVHHLAPISFVIAIFVMMALVRLVLMLLAGRLKMIADYVTMSQVGQVIRRLISTQYDRWIVRRRVLNDTEQRIDVIEPEGIGVLELDSIAV